MAAIIVINQVGRPAGTPGISRDDLLLGVTVNLSNFGVGSSYLWEFYPSGSIPPGSTATLTTPTLSTCDFTPDVVGSYIIKLTVDGVDTDVRIAAVKTNEESGRLLSLRIPGAGETNQYNNNILSGIDGWHEAVYNSWLNVDDNLVALDSYMRQQDTWLNNKIILNDGYARSQLSIENSLIRTVDAYSRLQDTWLNNKIQLGDGYARSRLTIENSLIRAVDAYSRLQDTWLNNKFDGYNLSYEFQSLRNADAYERGQTIIVNSIARNAGGGTFGSGNAIWLQSRYINPLAPLDGYVLMWNSGTSEWTPEPIPILASGFPNTTSTYMSFVPGALTFRIGGVGGAPWYYYRNGNIVNKSGSLENVVITNNTGLWYIYYNSSGTLTASLTKWNFITNIVPVATVYWNALTSDYFLADERHGFLMDPATRKYLNETIGYKYQSGLTLSGYTYGTDSNAAVQIGITDGYMAAEDMANYIEDGVVGTWFHQPLTKPSQLPILYRNGVNGYWNRDVASTFFTKTAGSGRVAYNQYVGGSWQQTEATNNYFVTYFIVATNDGQEPIVSLQGQREDSVLNDAINDATWDNIVFGTLPYEHVKVLYRIIVNTNTSFTNTNKYIISYVEDLREQSLVMSGSNINAFQLQGRNISATAPTNNEILTWNSTTLQWEPKITIASVLDAYALKSSLDSYALLTELYTVKISATDTTDGYLQNKIIEGLNCAIYINNIGGNENLQIGTTETIGFKEQAVDPIAEDNYGSLYSKDADGYTELFYIDNYGTITRITSDGYLDAYKIQGRIVANIAPQDGYALKWSASSNRWEPGIVATSGSTFTISLIHTTGFLAADQTINRVNPIAPLLITLPAVPSSTCVIIKNITSSTNKITIDSTPYTIDGYHIYQLTDGYASITLYSDKVDNWMVT